MKDAEARKNSDSHWKGKSFVDAAYEAVQDEKVVQVFTTGNRDFALQALLSSALSVFQS